MSALNVFFQQYSETFDVKNCITSFRLQWHCVVNFLVLQLIEIRTHNNTVLLMPQNNTCTLRNEMRDTYMTQFSVANESKMLDFFSKYPLISVLHSFFSSTS